MLRKRPELLKLKERKVEQILELCRQKVIREGWHKLSMRGVKRLLKQYNLSLDYYFPTKTHLGFALAENEFGLITGLIVAVKRDNLNSNPGNSPVTTLQNCTFTLIEHFQQNQNLFDLLLDLELIEEYNQSNLTFAADIKPVVPLKNLFKQELFELFHQISAQGSLSDPYKLLNDWFYLYFGLLRVGVYREFRYTEAQVKENIARLCAIKPP